MKVGRILLIGFIVAGVGVQLVPNELPPVEADNSQDLIQSGLVNENIGKLIRTACYDCHSNETVYPWYSYLAPSSWLVSKDVREGREALNFSHWESLEMLDKLALLDDLAIEVNEETMPMPIYTWMHAAAKLSEEERAALVLWAEEAMDILVEEEEEDDQEEGE
ncbi:heme-binding domain-containing protein [Lunatimonas salinarum]|uniref:heme-binding domain-containing protein n=1 Tax=Lunatimonas salinarum TaxID=1774590 RepID=UPI001ADF1A81|nr:heme-binding domain-containing protein [Lunatimonas salinarum]